jgi:hypothetical protein
MCDNGEVARIEPACTLSFAGLLPGKVIGALELTCMMFAVLCAITMALYSKYSVPRKIIFERADYRSPGNL